MYCIYVFAPGTALQLEYVAEVITPTYDGGAVDVVDLLLTNKGSRATDRIHILYPHGFPYVSGAPGSWLRLEDITGTFSPPESSHNVLYSSLEGVEIRYGRGAGPGRVPLEVRMPDPTDVTRDISLRDCNKIT